MRDKKNKKEGGSEKGGWKFTHFTSPGSAPGPEYVASLLNSTLAKILSKEIDIILAFVSQQNKLENKDKEFSPNCYFIINLLIH